ncbi:SMC-Scp complex subunit ScpB [Candidatus Parcubacteria bacterium]|nr:SMC-Scp complex subunit ScpB [Candidatus Parcubacteria bacterium]
MNELIIQLEALLFALGRPLSYEEIAGKLKVSLDQLRDAVAKLQQQSRGIVLVDDGKVLELRTSASSAELIEQVRKEEYSRDIGRAGLETLAAILYRGPLTRSEIDFIRGVNSSQILRTLTMRGLVRKITNPKDERSFLYEPTTEVLSQLGVETVHELPDFSEVRGKLQALESAYKLKEEAEEI